VRRALLWAPQHGGRPVMTDSCHLSHICPLHLASITIPHTECSHDVCPPTKHGSTRSRSHAAIIHILIDTTASSVEDKQFRNCAPIGCCYIKRLFRNISTKTDIDWNTFIEEVGKHKGSFLSEHVFFVYGISKWRY